MKRLLLASLLLLAGVAHGQTLTFSVDTTISGANVIPRLTWATTPAATSCTASGDAAWTGTKTTSGTQTLAAVAPPRSYTLTCAFPGDTTATVHWVAPTTNTDGSALTDLAGFRVIYGNSPTNFSQSRAVPGASVLTSAFNSLTPGTWYFKVRAVNTSGVESNDSNTRSKQIRAPVEVTQNVGIKVPDAPTDTTVE